MNSEPDPDNEESGGDEGLRRGNRSLMRLFFVLVAVNVAGLVWIAVRAGSPGEIRLALDVMFQLAIGTTVALFAFRAISSFPYRTTDLMGMTFMLAGWAKWTVDSVRGFAQTGFLPGGGSMVGILIQYFLLSASALLAGAAVGLWACQRLRIEPPFARLRVILPAMLALPAAAGCAAFLALALGEFGEREAEKVISKRPVQSETYMGRALVWMLLWFASAIITLFNTITFIRALALQAEVKDKAPMK